MSDQQPAQSDTQPFIPAPPEPEPGSPPVETQAVPAAPVRGGTGRPRGMGWVNVALAVAIAIAIGGIAFAAGRMTAPAAASAAGGNGRTFGNGGQFPGGFPGGGYFQGGFQGGDDGNGGAGGGLRGIFGAGGVSLEGTVESVSGDTLTLKLASGQTIQVSLGGTTTYHSQTAASSGDVQAGGTVIVRVQLGRGQGGGTTTPAATDVTIVP